MDKPVYVAGADSKEDIGAVRLQVRQQLIFLENPFVHNSHLLEQELRCDTFNGFLPGGIDGQQDDTVKEVEGGGEIIREIAGAGV